MYTFALIGYGYWGKTIHQAVSKFPDIKLKWIMDKDPTTFSSNKNLQTHYNCTNDISDLLSDSSVDAIIVATPPISHFQIAKLILDSGKHVLIEKPGTISLKESLELVNLADKKSLTIMVDYTFLYCGAVKRIKEEINASNLGQILYFDSARINLGLFRPDVDVIWDLASHDLSIILHLLDSVPTHLQAIPSSFSPNGTPSSAHLHLFFNSSLTAHVHCSWISPVKLRNFMVGGSKKMLTWNDLEQTEKIKIYDYGYQSEAPCDDGKFRVDYRRGDILVPKIELSEPLITMLNQFTNSISTKTESISSLKKVAPILCILDAAERSWRSSGQMHKIEYPEYLNTTYI